jgi:hypothetical protein
MQLWGTASNSNIEIPRKRRQTSTRLKGATSKNVPSHRHSSKLVSLQLFSGGGGADFLQVNKNKWPAGNQGILLSE